MCGGEEERRSGVYVLVFHYWWIIPYLGADCSERKLFGKQDGQKDRVGTGEKADPQEG
jgi:hypothetical protein